MGGVGHRWVKRLFITKEYKTNCENPEENENPEDFTFIFARAEDNTAMMNSPDGRAYLLVLSKMPNGKAMREGDWDALGGNYFKDFSRSKHVVPAFPIPKHWPRYRSIDYGLDKLACLWWAVDEDGRCWCYRELNAERKVVGEASALIKSATLPGEPIFATYAPTDIWSTQKDTGKTMAELFGQNGVPLLKASRDRVQGHMVVAEMMMPGSVADPYVKKVIDGCPLELPMLMFFECCQEVIGNLQDIQADEANPNDCAKEPHEITHNVDSVRYFAIMRKFEAANAREREAEALAEEDDEDGLEDYESVMCGGAISESYMQF